MTDDAGHYRTAIGAADADHIFVRGHDLAGELIGDVGFGFLAFWLVTARRPAPGELRLFEAVLVSLADHGLTPSVLAARLTLYGAPESMQGALAAGILGGGSRFLGVTEDTARFLGELVAAADTPSEQGDREIARAAIRERRAAGDPVPGLGHPIHKIEDPRVPALLGLAEQEGIDGAHVRMLRAVKHVAPEVLGRDVPINGAGAAGAILADLGFSLPTIRGVVLLARTAGLVGHLAEEDQWPLAPALYMHVDANTRYEQEASS
ncbi:citryl-CoA lyase [Spirillospora sp. CA-255316]